MLPLVEVHSPTVQLAAISTDCGSNLKVIHKPIERVKLLAVRQCGSHIQDIEPEEQTETLVMEAVKQTVHAFGLLTHAKKSEFPSVVRYVIESSKNVINRAKDLKALFEGVQLAPYKEFACENNCLFKLIFSPNPQKLPIGEKLRIVKDFPEAIEELQIPFEQAKDLVVKQPSLLRFFPCQKALKFHEEQNQ
jgi:hypothetical protein